MICTTCMLYIYMHFYEPYYINKDKMKEKDTLVHVLARIKHTSQHWAVIEISYKHVNIHGGTHQNQLHVGVLRKLVS